MLSHRVMDCEIYDVQIISPSLDSRCCQCRFVGCGASLFSIGSKRRVAIDLAVSIVVIAIRSSSCNDFLFIFFELIERRSGNEFEDASNLLAK